MRVPPKLSVVVAWGFRWAFRGGALLLGVVCLVLLFRTESDYAGLLSHPAHAAATVVNAKDVGRQTEYLIAFVTPAGTSEELWTESIDSGPRVGDRVSITYDALRVSDLKEGDHVYALSAVPPAVILLAMAGLLFWVAVAGMRAVPTGAADRIPSPRSAAGAGFRRSAGVPSMSEKKSRRRRRPAARRSRKVGLTDRDPEG